VPSNEENSKNAEIGYEVWDRIQTTNLPWY